MEEKATHLWQMYENGIEYQNKIGLRKNIPLFIDFYEGRQWPAPTENTKNLPRPVVNIVKMICRNKKSAILSSPVRITYKSCDANVDAEKFNSFAKDIQKEIFQDELDRIAMDDAVKKGSYFYHYYWDSTAVGKDGNIEGALRCEIIDPLNIFFANPTILDEQKQKWILISSHENIETLRQMCGKKFTFEELAKDIDPYAERDRNSCIVLTRYFKQNGEVYCERGTKNHIINEPFAISPDFETVKEELKVKSQKNFPKRQKSLLYPIVSGFYERREKSIYGIGEVEGLIPNQKAINFNIAMSLLNAQEMAWGKYVALPNALKGQKITNVPGQVLIDYSGTGDGIKRMSEQSMQSFPISIVETLTSMTRSASGSSELMTGEATSSSISGVAISYLQSQAQLPLEDLKNAFAHVKRKQGLILAQFFKQFYFEKEFKKTAFKDNGLNFLKKDFFSSSEFQDIDFDVIVEITNGTKATIASDISMLNECLKEGKISLETYIKSYPDCAISNKDEIVRQIEVEKHSTLSLLKEENENLKKEIEKALKDIETQKNAFDDITSLIDENKRLKEFIALNIKQTISQE